MSGHWASPGRRSGVTFSQPDRHSGAHLVSDGLIGGAVKAAVCRADQYPMETADDR